MQCLLVLGAGWKLLFPFVLEKVSLVYTPDKIIALLGNYDMILNVSELPLETYIFIRPVSK